MRINLFFITRISFLLLFSFFFQYQFIKVSEVKSEEKQLSQLWKSAIKNNVLAVIEAIQSAKPTGAKGTYIKGITLTSTMGVGVKLDPAILET